ncbi:MAG TPA: addiction module protein [Rhizomicrobium sp.]|nr:addiction module protein [Rhizomicrobium sp.]
MNDISDIFKLSIAERIQLVEDLWDSIAAESGKLPPLTAEQRARIDRRLAEHEKDPSSALDWETVRDRLWSLVK